MRKAIVRTVEELEAAQERTEQIRDEMTRHRIRMIELAYHLGRSEQTVYLWLRHGLTETQYMDIIEALGDIVEAERR